MAVIRLDRWIGCECDDPSTWNGVVVALLWGTGTLESRSKGKAQAEAGEASVRRAVRASLPVPAFGRKHTSLLQ